MQQVDDRSTFHQLMALKAQAVVALPGGLGTLDELFTILTQIQTGKLPEMPVVLVGKEYWEPIFETLRQQMLGDQRQTISPEDLERVVMTDKPAEVFRTIRDHGNTDTQGWFGSLVSIVTDLF